MELRHLRYFVAVVEEQSFTKASEKLFVAQPSLSRQVQNLEAELGIQLFERAGRPLKTTEAGQFFYQHALKLLSNAEEIKTMARRVGLVQNKITMGFVGSLLFGLLPKIVQHYRQQRPHLEIELLEMNTIEQIQALKEGRIDVGFGRLRIVDPAIRRVLLREEPLMVAVYSDHALAAQQQGVYLSDLIEEDHFLYPTQPKPNFSNQIRALFQEHHIVPKSITEIREIQLAVGLVAAGQGVCIVPESAKTIQLPNLHYLPLLDEAAVSPIFIAVRNLDESEDIRAVFESIYQVYDKESIGYERSIF